MDKNQIKSWSDNGMLIGSHTKNHKDLKNLSYDEKYLARQITIPTCILIILLNNNNIS